MSVGFYPTALKGCRGIVFTHGVRMGGLVSDKKLKVTMVRSNQGQIITLHTYTPLTNVPIKYQLPALYSY